MTGADDILKAAVKKQELVLRNLRGASDIVSSLEKMQDRVELSMKSVRGPIRDSAKEIERMGRMTEDIMKSMTDSVGVLRDLLGPLDMLVRSMATIYKNGIKTHLGAIKSELELYFKFIRRIMEAIRS
ncbi:hypothetical protein [Azospirillum sp. TSO5]|uniref:hypothetical protein n=1 Tax=Azospirillum sp. TSO5 TaxID=716760 RepID=UPI000D60388B|nr:hypothetical protein [Azospirillum sp. TSO5]PWC92910.1 hypothetical protein TSO5_15900 [Azospirillum sp. TSO5]